MNGDGGAGVCRANVDRLLAGTPTRRQLQARVNALQRLAEHCLQYFPWPALHASLMADVQRLKDAMK